MQWARQAGAIVVANLNVLTLVNAWLPERMNFPEAVLLNVHFARVPATLID
jgi:hypothetical protein